MLKLYAHAMSIRSWKDIKDDMEGASLIEYSLLIGLISALVIAIIVAVGNKVKNNWSALNSAMPAGG